MNRIQLVLKQITAKSYGLGDQWISLERWNSHLNKIK